MLFAPEIREVYSREGIDIEVTMDGPAGPGFWVNVGEPGVNVQSAWIPYGLHESLILALMQGAALIKETLEATDAHQG
jgi:hypothetical protein